MLDYVYLTLVAGGYNFIKGAYYGLSTWKHFVSKGLNYWYRDSMTNGRVRLFDSYLYDGRSVDLFLQGLDEYGKTIAQKMIKNITLIAQNNYCSYGDLYDAPMIQDQKDFAQYVLDRKGKYFPDFEYLYLTNDYYLHKTLLSIPELGTLVGDKDILDCGAFIGDTAVPLAHYFPQSIIHAFEPEPHNFQKLLDVVDYNQLGERVRTLELGVGDVSGATTISNQGAGAKIGEGSSAIEVITIDSYVNKHALQIGLIKRDVEGFEYESMIGAEQSIRQHKPVLIVSLYHRGKDFFEIKTLLESWNILYKFSLRKRNCFHPFADTVLICY